VKWKDRETFSHAVIVDKKTKRVVDPVSPSFEWPPAGKQVDTLMGAA